MLPVRGSFLVMRILSHAVAVYFSSLLSVVFFNYAFYKP